MSQQRYTPEFKDEAVRQVTEKGRSAQEVAARLGVSSHSLYRWGKAVRPDKGEQRADELPTIPWEVQYHSKGQVKTRPPLENPS